jgi:hypothetical protein
MSAAIKHIRTASLDVAYEESGNPSGDPVFLTPQPQIAVPTIALQGEADGVHRPQASAQQARFFAGPFERRVSPKVGHNPPREAPKAVADGKRPVLTLAPEPRTIKPSFWRLRNSRTRVVLTARLASALEPSSPNVMVPSSSETPLPFLETLLPPDETPFPSRREALRIEVFRPIARLAQASLVDLLELRRRVLLNR